MTKLKRAPEPAAAPDSGLFTLAELATRWSLHPEIVRRKAREANISIIRLSQKAIRFRVSEILKFEQECTDTGIKPYQVKNAASMHAGLAKSRAARKAAKKEEEKRKANFKAYRDQRLKEEQEASTGGAE